MDKTSKVHKIHKKIMQANFARKLRRLLILMICVSILGIGACTAVVIPQIGKIASDGYVWEEDDENHEEDRNQEKENRIENGDREKENRMEDGDQDREYGKQGPDSDWNDSEEKHREEDAFLRNITITGPIAAAAITAGIAALCMSILMFMLWLLIGAWLYQAAVNSGMNGVFWLAAGLVGNVAAAVVFLIVRSFMRAKCPSCGAFIQAETQYCPVCGALMYEKCGECGAECACGDKFCHVCGKQLHGEESGGEEA